MRDKKIERLLRESNGQITRRQVREKGIDVHLLTELTRAGQLERVDRGVYIDPAIFEDSMYMIQYRFSKGIFFKDSALFLHGMIDRTPGVHQMNFPEGYHATTIGRYPIKVYRQKLAWQELGVEWVLGPGQHKLRTYNVERTLCDIVRTRDSSDSETIKQAMVSYSKKRGKNLRRLNEYAAIFNVESKISAYMEVLL